ncbi:Bug family tripartite tricarboxylate transporter substrate binding protein [Cupriavidus basilensis]
MMKIKQLLDCTKLALALTCATFGVSSVATAANDWPSKPVRIIVGAPPGGAADTLSRIVAEGLTKSLGQPVIVEQKPGASGAIGAHELISSAPDGYTFMLFQRGIVTGGSAGNAGFV